MQTARIRLVADGGNITVETLGKATNHSLVIASVVAGRCPVADHGSARAGCRSRRVAQRVVSDGDAVVVGDRVGTDRYAADRCSAGDTLDNLSIASHSYRIRDASAGRRADGDGICACSRRGGCSAANCERARARGDAGIHRGAAADAHDAAVGAAEAKLAGVHVQLAAERQRVRSVTPRRVVEHRTVGLACLVSDPAQSRGVGPLNIRGTGGLVLKLHTAVVRPVIDKNALIGPGCGRPANEQGTQTGGQCHAQPAQS